MARRCPSGHGRGRGRPVSWRALSVAVRSGPPDHRGALVRSALLRAEGMIAKAAVRRCAVYTRKSSEEGLEWDFNSLHAQREACEAFVRSQRGEGWRLIETAYDDGGLSGGTLERPALQHLLADIAQHRVDTVVVYKVDRLTRSLMDFAKLVELFDQHRVTFVSITQQFNTTTSMGRLTLNILLSFAQFEREVIGERVRDKIAASKRKGLWVGGPVPLGYAAVNKKIAIVPAEAETVRMIFARYLELGSIRALTEDLKRRGLRAKERRLSNGDIRGGGPLGTGSLTHLLRNRFYVGEVVYRGEVFSADHEPIVERPLFEAVQARLSTQAVERRCRARGLPALLAGRLFDDKGQRLTPTHSNKAGVRYRYYVSTAAGRRVRIAAPELEARVTQAMRDHLRQTERAEVEALPDDDRELIKRYLVQVIVTATALRAEVRQAIDGNALDAAHPDYSNGSATQIVISVPWSGATASA